MNTALWIIQGLLAAMFASAGTTKLTQSKEKLGKQFPWANDFSMSTIRIIGLSELLGAIGLIVPWLTGIIPVLTPIAAVGFCIIMVLATNMAHLNKKEYKEMAMNIVLFLLAAFVAYGRF
jgi:uncharacterized membrane protein YphA (DoxX/SURF4 family)